MAIFFSSQIPLAVLARTAGTSKERKATSMPRGLSMSLSLTSVTGFLCDELANSKLKIQQCPTYRGIPGMNVLKTEQAKLFS